jgi:hypothetical protein
VYRTCTHWRKELSNEGFHMGTFALCTALSNVAQTFERAQAIIGQEQLAQTGKLVSVLLLSSSIVRCSVWGR